MKKDKFKYILPEKYLWHRAFERLLAEHANDDDDEVLAGVCTGLNLIFGMEFSGVKDDDDLMDADEEFHKYMMSIINCEYDMTEQLFSPVERKYVEIISNIFDTVHWFETIGNMFEREGD